MNQIATIETPVMPAMIENARTMLAEAKTSAEILEARAVADEIYNEAKRRARASAKVAAHADVTAKMHAAQAEALKIIAKADAQLADQYDAAQERGEIATVGKRSQPERLVEAPPNARDIGVSRKQIMEARQVRDAEAAQPGIVARVLDEAVAKGEEPTKAALRKVVVEEARKGLQGRGQPTLQNRNPLYVKPTEAGEAWTHLYAQCRALNEWATPEKIALARSGFRERTDDQMRNIAAIRTCAANLNKIIGELFDA